MTRIALFCLGIMLVTLFVVVILAWQVFLLNRETAVAIRKAGDASKNVSTALAKIPKEKANVSYAIAQARFEEQNTFHAQQIDDNQRILSSVTFAVTLLAGGVISIVGVSLFYNLGRFREEKQELADSLKSDSEDRVQKLDVRFQESLNKAKAELQEGLSQAKRVLYEWNSIMLSHLAQTAKRQGLGDEAMRCATWAGQQVQELNNETIWKTWLHWLFELAQGCPPLIEAHGELYAILLKSPAEYAPIVEHIKQTLDHQSSNVGGQLPQTD